MAGLLERGWRWMWNILSPAESTSSSWERFCSNKSCREEPCWGEPGPAATWAWQDHSTARAVTAVSWRVEVPGKCFVHEFFPWGSSWLACLCDQGCSKGVRLFPAVLKAAGKRLCGLQCCTVIFCYPATGCTQLKDPAGGHRAGEWSSGCMRWGLRCYCPAVCESVVPQAAGER